MLMDNCVPYMLSYVLGLYRNTNFNNEDHSVIVYIKKSVHKKCFEVDCKWSSGLLVMGVRAGKCSFAQVVSAKDKCKFQPIIRLQRCMDGR